MNRSNAGAPGSLLAPATPADVLRLLRRDIERTQTPLPKPLRPLAEIAWNYAATWLPDGPETFAEIDAGLWTAARRSPRLVLEAAAPGRLAGRATWLQIRSSLRCCNPEMTRGSMSISSPLALS